MDEEWDDPCPLIRVSIAIIRFIVVARTHECKNKVNGCAVQRYAVYPVEPLSGAKC